MFKLRLVIAIFLFSAGVSIFAQNAKQHYKAGEQFFENGMNDAAIEEFEKSIMLNPNDGRTYESKANVHLFKGDSVLAAHNYCKAAALGYNASGNYFRAASVYHPFQLISEAEDCITKGLIVKPKNFDLLLLKTRINFESENYSLAYQTAEEAIKAKDMAIAFYYKGASAHRLGLTDEAEKILEKAIIRDRNLEDAYLEIAEIQIEQERYDYAIDNCTMVLLLIDPENIRALVLRSKALHNLKDSDDAIADITKAIRLSDYNYDLILIRAQYNLDYALYSNAIDDYSIAIGTNNSSFATINNRAFAYEKLGRNEESLADYKVALALLESKEGNYELKDYTRNRIFELGKEDIKPVITVDNPTINKNLELTIEVGKTEINISGIVQETSELKELKINNNSVEFLKTAIGEYSFNHVIPTVDLDFVSITAADIYGNLNTESYPISHIETDAPTIELISPLAGGANVIQLETDDNTLYIEGRIIDNSYITSIKIDEVNASFTPGDYNPKFTATIDVRNRKNITVKVTDAFGNVSQQTYEFAKGGYLFSENNPMGKTWVVIIENSDYNEYTRLTGPAKDVAELTKALSRYKISKILHKKNMSKRELEQFFTIDLRDLIISNNVNSLLIWYAGHGQNINNSGYWIPVDGRQNDEYSFYNINALKASLYSYRSLTHILVVSDACNAGDSFTIAMRGDNSLATCDNINMIQQKSALVLTSSFKEPAMDNSLFTRTFTNALSNNPTDCIPIDAIAERISIVMYKNTAQKPVFGRIAGLENNNGTFFFISK